MLSSSPRRVRSGALLFASIFAVSGAAAFLPARWQVPTAAAPVAGAILQPAGSTLTVNSTTDVANGTDGLCTLREAITAANTDTASGAAAGECAAGSGSGDDTINFSVTGTITLTSALPDLSTGILINGPGADVLTVSGNASVRVFNVTAASPGVTLSGLTISNGSALFNDGGGINNNSAGTVNVSNCAIIKNTASSGGGIFNNSTGTVNIDNSVINGSTIGGGVINWGAGTINITNSTLSSNLAVSWGGGLYNHSTGTVNITNSTLSGNNSHGGGGIGVDGGTVTVVNSSLSGNSTFQSGLGGGALATNGTLSLTNVTITNNRSGGGSGIRVESTASSTLRNTIVAGNFVGDNDTDPDDISGAVGPTSAFNLIGTGGSGGLTNGINNNQVGVSNPGLGPLANNGGPTMTHALLAGSPALDAANNAFITNPPFAGPPFTDQRGTGFSRIVDGPDADTTDTADIGAYEAQVSVEAITNQTTNEDTQLQFVFNVGGAGAITSITASSGNTTLVPNDPANIAISGSGSTRTLAITPAANGFGASTITVTVNGTSGQIITDAFVLTVNAVADTPSVTNAATNEDTQTTTGLVITRSPVDGAEVTHYKISGISGGTLFQNNGLTQINNGDFITVAEGAAGLKFTPTLDSNFNGGFQAQASLGNTNAGLGGNFATATITVNAVNDAPVNSVPGPQSVIENSSLTFSAANSNAISTADVDAGTAAVRVQLTATNGTITLSSIGGLSFTVGDGTADATMTFSGTLASINADMNGMQFSPNQGYNGGASLQIITNDQGNSGSGGALSDTDTVNITVLDGGALQFSASAYTQVENAPIALITVSRTGGTAGEARVDYATSNGTATAGADYTATSGTLIFASGVKSQTFSVAIIDDTSFEPNETVNLTLSNAAGSGALGTPIAATLTILNDDAQGGVISFSSGNYTVAEDGKFVTITVNRGGDTSAAATVDYATSDNSDPANFVPCSTINGHASSRCDFNTAAGTLSFAPGDMSKTFKVTITQDSYVETSETFPITLSNLTGGAVFGVPATTTVTITDDVPEPATNPIDDSDSFVRQHYHDFLNREGDSGGQAFWTSRITDCGNDAACMQRQRIGVSAQFFIEQEFQQTGFYVYRAYKAGLGRRPTYVEFITDRSQLQANPNLDAEKVTYSLQFVQRTEFTGKYSSANTASAFVDALIQNVQTNSGVDLTPRRNELLAAYNAGSAQTDSRARTLRALVDHPDFQAAEYNRGFVLAQYFSYLRRNPDSGGFNFWLNVLNNNPNDFRAMVCNFITSAEYQDRFGAVRTHNNSECSGSPIAQETP